MTPANQATSSPSILIVDDRPENLYSLETILKHSGAHIITAQSGAEALKHILSHEVALILMDVQMPEMDGFETAELIRGNQDTQYIPIIFVTANSKEETHVFKGYESGAVDYIFKPLAPEILRNKVKIFLDLHRQKKTIEQQNEELSRANEKILEQPNALIEEERVKVVLQMAGAAAHALSQPLTVLLGNIELLQMDAQQKKIEAKPLERVFEAGQRLAKIVHGIQKVDTEHMTAEPPVKSPANPGARLTPPLRLLCLEPQSEGTQNLDILLGEPPGITLTRATDIAGLIAQMSKTIFDLILLDRALLDQAAPKELNALARAKKSMPAACFSWKTSPAPCPPLPFSPVGHLELKGMTRDHLIHTLQTLLERKRLDNNIGTAMKKMAAMSTRDELTGLYNRRYLNEILSQEFKRSIRYSLPFSCLLIDLDLFKQVNDTHGHDCGDFILAEFAALLTSLTRESDALFRYGGDEFVALLPQTDVMGGCQVGESICQKCREHCFSYNGVPIPMTLSIGVVSNLTSPAQTGKELLRYADKALYGAKKQGRDGLCVYSASATVESNGTEAAPREPSLLLEEQVVSILNRSKHRSIKSLELLIRDIGGKALEAETRQTIQYVQMICKKLKLSAPETQSISQAVSLNNCFKGLLDESLLTKSVPLSREERVSIEQLPHKQLGLMDQFDFFKAEKQILLHNHERYDGKGYPNALQSNDIPMGSRILALSSAVVAMGNPRPYRPKMDPEQVISEVVENAGTQFDPDLVKIFLDLVEEEKALPVPPPALSAAKQQLTGKGGPR